MSGVMVERVAALIWDDYFGGTPSWDAEREASRTKESFRGLARAVIAAMSPPTEMVDVSGRTLQEALDPWRCRADNQDTLRQIVEDLRGVVGIYLPEGAGRECVPATTRHALISAMSHAIATVIHDMDPGSWEENINAVWRYLDMQIMGQRRGDW